MIEVVPVENSNMVHLFLAEHLHKQDYEQFVAKLNVLVQEHGKIRILFDLARFTRWNSEAPWFGIRHFPDVERVALIGKSESSFKKTYVYKTYLADDAIKVNAKADVVALKETIAEEARKTLAQATAASLPEASKGGTTSVKNEMTIVAIAAK